ncbi:DUF4291 family protein [Actibacterium sp. 188UL27-1]|uniref:DUF4291 family protein n=1 Tax=Actibacterium sp. 188UL27-1 TaxID=2786961 RepID=UPI001958FBEF|nr:DUF4291 family protein [Actibacterium sp. 188UL27-1]MBM7066808.1 DUF4291 family protein [Actibacterium sp. 188UL27-1]
MAARCGGLGQAQGGSLYFEKIGIALSKYEMPGAREFILFDSPIATANAGPLSPCPWRATITCSKKIGIPTKICCDMDGRQIRTIFDRHTVRVYQAYPPQIARAALSAGTFVPPFKMERMTWIKPSFCRMMHRCGYGRKPGQEMVLGIDIRRSGFF